MSEKHDIGSSDDHPPHHVLESNSLGSALGEIKRIILIYIRPLAATGLAWLLLDITFYGTGQFRHSVSGEIFPQDEMSGYEVVSSDATFGLIIAAIALPGYVFATIFIDSIGHWNLQAIGFVMMTLAYLAMALVVQFDCKVVWVNLTVFGLTFFFTTFGPNTTTFLIPSEIYPRAVRATCHGISAALGKIGAIIGTAGFPPAMDTVGLNGIMYICTGITAAGFFVTVLLLSKPLVDSAANRHREPHAAGSCLETTHAPPVSPGDAALVLSRSISTITPIPCNS